MFQFKHFQFLVDFAHNPAGLELLCDFIGKLDGEPKVGIISGTGDSNLIAVTSKLSLCAPTVTPTYHCDTRKNSLLQLPAASTDCSSDPALFAARVRIACPSFVDVDEVVLGSA